MITLYKKSGIIIPIKYKNEEFYFQIKEYLKRRTKDYQTSTYRSFQFFLESEHGMLIPRFFPVGNFIKDFEIIDKIPDPESIKIEHNIVPRTDVQKRIFDQLNNLQNCLLQLPPGVGKTVIMIKQIASLKKKSFIIVHRDSLVDQWKDRILQFTNLNEDNIARLKSKSFLEDLQKSIILTTNQTFISLLKRNRTEFLVALHNAKIGIFIADEVHTSVGAPTFAECSIHIPAKYVYGLSATPYRNDGNADILTYHLGETIADEDTSGTMEPRINVILADYEIDIPKRYMYLHWEGKFQKSRYLNIMKNSLTFMNITKGLINRFKGNRKLLVMSERVEKMINILYNWVDYDDKGKFISGSDLSELQKSLIFSTPNKVRDGVDAVHIDCLIMTSPISNIEQMIGRVIRFKQGKEQPIVVDMVDIGCKDLKRTVYNRLTFYSKKNWKVKFMFYTNSSLKIIDEEIAKNILEGK